MTTLIQFHDAHTHLLGLDGLVDMLGPCVVSVETGEAAKDHFVESDIAVYALADEIIRRRLDAGIMEARFGPSELSETVTLALYKEPGLIALIVFDAKETDRPFRVMRTLSEQILDAPLYRSRNDAQMAFDAIVRPRLDARFAARTVGAAITLNNTSNSASTDMRDRP
jgi:hypothetical protein